MKYTHFLKHTVVYTLRFDNNVFAGANTDTMNALPLWMRGGGGGSSAGGGQQFSPVRRQTEANHNSLADANFHGTRIVFIDNK
jgi:hypothetical protein